MKPPKTWVFLIWKGLGSFPRRILGVLKAWHITKFGLIKELLRELIRSWIRKGFFDLFFWVLGKEPFLGGPGFFYFGQWFSGAPQGGFLFWLNPFPIYTPLVGLGGPPFIGILLPWSTGLLRPTGKGWLGPQFVGAGKRWTISCRRSPEEGTPPVWSWGEKSLPH